MSLLEKDRDLLKAKTEISDLKVTWILFYFKLHLAQIKRERWWNTCQSLVKRA